MMKNDLSQKAHRLHIHAVMAHWQEISGDESLLHFIEKLLNWEEDERTRRRLDSFIKKSNVKHFEPLAHFDWSWPKKIDAEQIRELFTLNFIEESENVVFIGPNGVGKTMLMKNLVHSAARRGYSSLFVESGQMLEDLMGAKHQSGIERVMAHYVKPKVLGIDEIGYLSYNNQHADLLFQLVHRRSEVRNPTLVTTNRTFEEWGDVFPNAASVTALIDRLVERCEVVSIEGSSFRERRFLERQQSKLKARSAKKK